MIKHWKRLPRDVLESLSLEIQKPYGHGPEQPDLDGPAWAGWLNNMTSRGPSEVNYSVILCESVRPGFSKVVQLSPSSRSPKTVEFQLLAAAFRRNLLIYLFCDEAEKKRSLPTPQVPYVWAGEWALAWHEDWWCKRSGLEEADPNLNFHCRCRLRCML